jgi:hypothetical protein
VHSVSQEGAQTDDRIRASKAETKARVIAFYLPQFHPIPENNAWWGAGFTEWTNVAKAKPLFRGHPQPHLPADLGFYDLRVPEVRELQAELARSAGVEGFCYWHYWFGNGRRILERPFDEMLASGRPNFPFCLAWANQSWTGIWHGAPRHTLIEQIYPGQEDSKAHFDLVLKAFRDRRYMTVDGKPIFIVLDPKDMPETDRFIDQWRDLARQAGLPGIHFCGMCNELTASLYPSFDMMLTFGPGDFIKRLPQGILYRIIRRLKRGDLGPTLNSTLGRWINRPQRFDYARVVGVLMGLSPPDSRYVPCVLPNWDNTPRSGLRGVVFEDSSPDIFEKYLSNAVSRVASLPAERRIIFLKAWNEWAEGNYVEPDSRVGHGYLDAMRNVLMSQSNDGGSAHS